MWIETKDRFPEEYAWILTCDSNSRIGLGISLQKDGNRVFFDPDQNLVLKDITHWQPLPAPPSKQKRPFEDWMPNCS